MLIYLEGALLKCGNLEYLCSKLSDGNSSEYVFNSMEAKNIAIKYILLRGLISVMLP